MDELRDKDIEKTEKNWSESGFQKINEVLDHASGCVEYLGETSSRKDKGQGVVMVSQVGKKRQAVDQRQRRQRNAEQTKKKN